MTSKLIQMKRVFVLLLLVIWAQGSVMAQNKVLSLDGDGDYFEFGNVIVSSCTIEAWYVKLGDAGGSGKDLPVLGSDSVHIGRRMNNNFWGGKWNDSWYSVVESNIGNDDFYWYHVAFVFEGADTKVYIDGKLIGQLSTSEAEKSISFVGKAAAGNHFKGLIDEVRIWNEPLSIDKIIEFKDKSLTGNEKGLVGYWNFENGTNDLSMNGNDGKLNGNAEIITQTRGREYIGRIINVPDEYTSIQSAIDKAIDGDRIVVKPGKYIENVDFKGKKISLTSLFLEKKDPSFISSTIIDGDANGFPVVQFVSGEVHSSKLIGFTIQNGFTATKEQGAGINIQSASPTLEHLIIQNNNSQSGRGGGIRCFYAQTPILRNLVIKNNICNDMGGGIYSAGGWFTVKLENCIFTGNSASYGSAISFHGGQGGNGGEPLVNCLFYDHAESRNLINGTDIILLNCTLYEKGALELWGNSALVNCIVWGEVKTEIKGVLEVSNSIINDGKDSLNIPFEMALKWNTGNLADEPKFVSLEDRNFLLADNSPAIGIAAPSVILWKKEYSVPRTDIDGNPRPNPLDSQPDIGAYESDLAVITDRPKPILSVVDKEINFGSVEIGNSTLAEIFLTNAGDADLTITSVISNLKDFTITSLPFNEAAAPEQSGKLSIEFYPRSEGEISATIAIKSNGGIETVTVKGTGVIASAEKSYKASLAKGLNFISLPLQPETPMTAKSLSAELGATVLIKLDKQSKEFVSYVPEVFDSFNFTLEGAEGYIVNVMKDQDITFNGTAWDNTAAAPSNLDQLSSVTWAFTVVIDHPQLTRQPGLISNLRTGQTISTSAITSADLSSIQKQAVSLVDQSRQPVVEAGDLIEVNVGNSRWRYQLNQSELERAYVHLDLAQMTSLPNQTQLLQNYPNPFNPETWIPFDLAEDTGVAVTIYDVEGQTIRTLDLGWVMAGRHHNRSQSIYWDGRTEMGETVASGVYFYQISAADFSHTKRMVILK